MSDQINALSVQQQQQQQQQVYMSPQAENLNHMYLLVNKLVIQLRENQAEKAKILRNIDVLSGKLSKYETTEEPHDTTDNIALFNKFLEQREKAAITGEEQLSDDLDENAKDDVMLGVLKRQNTMLRKSLEESKQKTLESMDLLSYSEDSLNYIVAQLRGNILMHHKETTKLIRQKFQVETIPLEDKEFKMYLENVNDLQKLTDISHAYRLLLRLHAQE
ncbi:Far7p [Saccharomyces paradoxus]|uniref:Far7p n=1 Tax=Saccharomyces paradoxus TaxID=27291 RepID=A0A8B8UQL8_SACPA|nr:Far7 [Saccharomyces paradoxus]QHS73040.1 Far7 [Saccharomyces paradoxus]